MYFFFYIKQKTKINDFFFNRLFFFIYYYYCLWRQQQQQQQQLQEQHKNIYLSIYWKLVRSLSSKYLYSNVKPSFLRWAHFSKSKNTYVPFNSQILSKIIFYSFNPKHTNLIQLTFSYSSVMTLGSSYRWNHIIYRVWNLHDNFLSAWAAKNCAFVPSI